MSFVTDKDYNGNFIDPILLDAIPLQLLYKVEIEYGKFVHSYNILSLYNWIVDCQLKGVKPHLPENRIEMSINMIDDVFNTVKNKHPEHYRYTTFMVTFLDDVDRSYQYTWDRLLKKIIEGEKPLYLQDTKVKCVRGSFKTYWDLNNIKFKKTSLEKNEFLKIYKEMTEKQFENYKLCFTLYNKNGRKIYTYYNSELDNYYFIATNNDDGEIIKRYYYLDFEEVITMIKRGKICKVNNKKIITEDDIYTFDHYDKYPEMRELIEQANL